MLNRKNLSCLSLSSALLACASPPAPHSHVESSAPIVETSRTSPPALVHAAPSGCEPSKKGTTYDVGPSQKYQALKDVPFEKLGPGDTVRIHHRAEPYREKLMVSGVGKPDAPIRVCGVRGPKGERPVLDGHKATTRASLDFPFDGHQPRGLVIVGHPNRRPWLEQPQHLVIEGLELTNADPSTTFFDKTGAEQPWSKNAAGIFVQRASHVTIRDCAIHHNGNGLFIGTSGADELTRHVLIEGNEIHTNASDSEWFQHNVYNEASNVTYQFNRFGPVRRGKQGELGANIKERSAGVVIRYNIIEDGAHLIGIVDSQEARGDNLKDPAFHETWIYGNLMIRGKQPGGALVHYGGDSGLTDTYRKGQLHFHHNTVVIKNATHPEYQPTVLFQLTTMDEKLDMVGNVVWTEKASSVERATLLLGGRDGACNGVATLQGNWISDGVTALPQPGPYLKVNARVDGFDASLRGADPGIGGIDAPVLRPAAGSPLLAQRPQRKVPPAHALTHEPGLGSGAPRRDAASAVPGAFSPAQ